MQSWTHTWTAVTQEDLVRLPLYLHEDTSMPLDNRTRVTVTEAVLVITDLNAYQDVQTSPGPEDYLCRGQRPGPHMGGKPL